MICSLLFFQTYHLSSSHVSAYSIEFAVQIHKNREHVSAQRVQETAQG